MSRPRNLAELIALRASNRPDHRFGMIDGTTTLGQTWDAATRAAATYAELGIAPGARVAVVGSNADAYLVNWMALQLAGAEAALVNPTYPADLLTVMMADLDPDAVIWVGPDVDRTVRPDVPHLDAVAVDQGKVGVEGGIESVASEAGDLPGLGRTPTQVAGYMHTSGTTGTPKFCVQTHEYFVRLGRYIADTLAIHPDDTVYAPLPLFHINPLGYGVIGGLTAGAGVVSNDKFSARRFWPQVKEAAATVLFLHAPPVEILKRATTAEDAAGHQVRVTFFADGDFLETFGIPMGISAYGSTEAGGLSHTWTWRRGDRADDLPEGMSRYGGTSRHELVWRVDEHGEIHLKADRPNVLFDGYFRRGALDPALGDDGWFATGDLGRVDEFGNLVFIERLAESIRVKGEYVPIGFVEDHLAGKAGITDLALWRSTSDLVDHEVVLYVTTDGTAVDADGIRAAAEELPAFMRPSTVLRVTEIPRDAGVGKIRRRQLGDCQVLEQVAL